MTEPPAHPPPASPGKPVKLPPKGEPVGQRRKRKPSPGPIKEALRKTRPSLLIALAFVVGVALDLAAREAEAFQRWTLDLEPETVVGLLSGVLATFGFVTAITNVWLSRRATINAQRAWVLVRAMRVDWQAFWNTGAIVPRLEVENFGAGPAFEVRVQMNAAFRPPDHPLDDLHPPKHGPGKATLGPGQEKIIEAPGGKLSLVEAMTATILVRRDEARIVLYGTIRYRDQFGRRRRTRFRAMAAADGDFALTAGGNSAG